MALTVRTITAREHQTYVASRPSVAIEQTPGWGRGFVAARTESVGWFDGDTLIGAGLFRYRGLPRLPQRSVAVFEAGPDIDWTGRRRPKLTLRDWLAPLADHLRGRGVFTARVNPLIAVREWWGFDPRVRSDAKEVVLHRARNPLPDAVATQERLREAGWRTLANAPPQFLAEVSVSQARDPEAERNSRAVLPALAVRTGTPEDLADVCDALGRAHPGVPMPSLKDLQSRWRGLASDNFAGVTLLVVEREATIVHGGLLAVVGERAWDLSVPLPLPDADAPAVQVLRHRMLTQAREAGAKALAVPTVVPQRGAPVRAPAPGWPAVHLSQLTGTWHFGVRATWHGVLSPIVDRLML
jgi:hypothetical protein